MSKSVEELEQTIKTLEGRLSKQQERRVRFRPMDDLQTDVKRLQKQLRDEQASRKRVVAAFLALREVKSVEQDLEPVVLSILKRLNEIPENVSEKIGDAIAAALKRRPEIRLDVITQLSQDTEEQAARVLEREVKAIRIYTEKRLSKMASEPRTPANARYVAADHDLKPGDLAIRETT